VITESGSYVVTADFTAITGNAIKLLGDITVDIGFAGHSVGATGAAVIMVRNSQDEGAPFVTLHDGRVIGAGSGVYSWTNFSSPRRVAVEIARMTFETANVWVEDGSVTVRSCRFINSEMAVYSNRGGANGVFEDNDVWGADIVAGGTSGSLIRRNQVRGGSIRLGEADTFSSSHDVVEENHVIDGSIRIGSPWSGAFGGSSQILVRRNVVSGAILLGESYEASIVENRVGGCSARGSGITVTGVSRLGLFERNVVTGACPYGIAFDDLTRGNLYRDNVMPRATCGLVLDNGLDNTDGGGNRPTRASKKCEAPTE
jgi:hypothetical protein